MTKRQLAEETAEGKLAYIIARKIAEQVVDRGWVVGEKLGTEPELLKRFRVSREPFREAIRILERQGIVRSERGWNGGLVVQAPALTAVSKIIKTYFEFADISFSEVTEAHAIAMHYGIDQATTRMTPAHANDLRRLLGKPRGRFRSRDQEGRAVSEIYEAIVKVADDPSLSMLVFTLSRISADFGHQEHYPKKLWNAMITQTWQNARRLAECAMRGDAKGAKCANDDQNELVGRVVKDLERQNHRIWNMRSFLRGSYSSATLNHELGEKAAARLSYRITAQIRRTELPPGTILGTESALMKKFGVSRAMFREAVRMLEFFGVVTIKRGIGGGLTITEPNSSSTVLTAVLYLRYFRPDGVRLRTLLHRFERDALTLAATRASHTDVETLVGMLADASITKPGGLAVHVSQIRRSIVKLCENRALELIIEIIDSVQAADHVSAPSAHAERLARSRILTARRDIQLASSAKSSSPLEAALVQLLNALQEFSFP
jgi:DNA-binding FadR family transcriptional regulator